MKNTARHHQCHNDSSDTDSVLFFTMNSKTGKWINVIGMLFLMTGISIYFFHDKLHWFGGLPGDIRIEKEHFRCYFPAVTMILLSVLVTIIVNGIKKFLQ